jgi:(S)-ureidoglycine aminohydrolase
MRPADQLVHSRTRVRQRYALMPLEGFPISRLPSWPDAEVKVLASPALGAQFVQYLIDLPAGKTGEFAADDSIETFYYVMSGVGLCTDSGAFKAKLAAGRFGLMPTGRAIHVAAEQNLQLIVLRKRYERAPGVEIFEPISNHESAVKKEVWADNPHSLLQTLIPDEFRYDIAMNIFTFDPGFGLPIVETHVMEHGLYFLQGKGVYYLDGEWMEVTRDDFIWMGPYCPQSFYATGPTPARYLYYKNVNREIPL